LVLLVRPFVRLCRGERLFSRKNDYASDFWLRIWWSFPIYVGV